MSDPEDDQRLAQLRDGLPKIWFAIYQGCIDAGFTEPQAMELVKFVVIAHLSIPSRS